MSPFRSLRSALVALVSSRRGRSETARTCRPTLEGLEQRWVPANVTAIQNGSLLTLIADQNNNGAGITISSTVNGVPGSYTIADGNGTTTINGMASATVGGNITQIQVSLRGGDGSVTIEDGVFLPGQMLINLANGTNQVTVDSKAQLGSLVIGARAGSTGTDTVTVLDGAQVLHNLKIDTSNSSGASTITLGDHVHVGGNLNVKTGSADDSVTLGNVFVVGKTTMNLGDGNNTFTADNKGHLVGALVYLGGAGVNTVTLGGDLSVSGNVTITALDGANLLQLGSGLNANKSVNVTLGNGNNTANLQGIQVAGGVNLFAGQGNNQVALSDDWVGGALSVGLGDGNNTLSIDEASSTFGSVFTGAVTLSTGKGTNVIAIGGANPDVFDSAVMMSSNSSAGNGTTFTIDDATFQTSLNIRGGFGSDNVNIETRTTSAGLPSQILGTMNWIGNGGHYTITVGVAGDAARQLLLSRQPNRFGTSDGHGTLDLENVVIAGQAQSPETINTL
jgi:hypothetical protein